MSEYCSKQILSGTSPVAFHGAAPTTPRKSNTCKWPPAFPSFSADHRFDSKLDDLFGRENISLSKGTIQQEFERYVSGQTFSHGMDILLFWEVSFPYTIRDEHSQSE
jgi:hypothetical protein